MAGLMDFVMSMRGLPNAMQDYTLGAPAQFRQGGGVMTGGFTPSFQVAPTPMPMSPPMPPPRPAMPAPPVGAPTPIAGASPSVRESFMQRLLSGPNYQSNNMPTVMSPQGPTASGGFLPQSVNWGDPESAADFFRADQAARQLGLLG